MSHRNLYETQGADPGCKVEYGLNDRVQPLWLQQSLIDGFHAIACLWASGQQASVKCAEAVRNY